MASHRRLVKHFGRKSNARKALLRGLMRSLILHGRIKTTLMKAKETRRYIEKAITLGKKNNLNSIRVLSSKFADAEAAVTLVKTVAPRFSERPGGYTRIIKLGARPGDKAEMAYIEFVDFDWKSKSGAAGTEATAAVKTSSKKSTKAKKDGAEQDAQKVAAKQASKAKKEQSELAWKRRKAIRKIQNSSRAESHSRN